MTNNQQSFSGISKNHLAFNIGSLFNKTGTIEKQPGQYLPFVPFTNQETVPALNYNRYLPPHQHGPERVEERPPLIRNAVWAALFPNEVILHGPTNRRHAALTFDDGPDDVWTPQVLDTLLQLNVKATFMCVGQRVRQYPHILQRIVKEGHVVGNHSWSHPNLTKIPISEVRRQIESTNYEILRIAGVKPLHVRPPYGAINFDVIHEITALGEKIILGNVDSLDWAGLTGPQITANILSNVKPGAIILQHSAGDTYDESMHDTVEAIPYTVQTLRKEGCQFVTVPQLIKIKPYH